MRAKTSRITVASASANDIDGNLPITGPMSSGGASANGCVHQARLVDRSAVRLGGRDHDLMTIGQACQCERHQRPEMTVVTPWLRPGRASQRVSSSARVGQPAHKRAVAAACVVAADRPARVTADAT